MTLNDTVKKLRKLTASSIQKNNLQLAFFISTYENS